MHEAASPIEFDPLSKQVVDCAFKIHQAIGSGLLEGIYEDCFEIELNKRKIPFERQKIINVNYEGITVPTTYRLDLVIDNKIIIELKSVEKIIRAHQAQILTYMRTSNLPIGYIINFGEPHFKSGIKRLVI